MHALIQNGAVAQYPYSLTDLIRANPQTMWPRMIGPELALSYGVHPVADATPPEFDPLTQALTELPPSLVDGVWTRRWEVRVLTQEEIDAAYQATVPQSVTMRQARLALLGAGVLSAVDAAIAAMDEPAKAAALIAWEYSTEVQRSFGLVSQLAPALGLTDAQVDALFIAAAQL